MITTEHDLAAVLPSMPWYWLCQVEAYRPDGARLGMRPISIGQAVAPTKAEAMAVAEQRCRADRADVEWWPVSADPIPTAPAPF